MSAEPAPAVSVVLPTYNRAAVLPRAVESTLRQTFPDWELVIVDDGSVDATGAVLQQFVDGRIRYVRGEHNRGVAAARQVGLTLARAPYVTFLDSDDEYRPEKLAAQVRALRQRGEAVECGMRLVLPDGRERDLAPVLYRKSPEQFGLVARGINLATLLIPREAALATGFDEAIRFSMSDWDFVLRLLRRCRVTAVVPQPLVVHYSHRGPRMSTAANLMRGLEYVLAKYEGTEVLSPRVRARLLHRLAAYCIGRGDLPRARQLLRRSVASWPWSAPRWLMLAAVALQPVAFDRFYAVYGRVARVLQRLRVRTGGVLA
ncbi:MAG: glycosyltransferase family 2 protein [Armatimonadota bacterium]|nr:glycosyltransferase family 2 protein [Armatimonadota bacterium]MDR7448525.1 glycosyltransferase family 2 protein [Armatimonadota bacterium]MDR7459075.1 glycosyltransferase family 2 protein [Armatimonadota bacterium]MDR7479391.1 glycosyltransferase family 2 protein [Armatimonadota bacterium]MDR7487433.1 glycosyltransferase family 2 protein [Armatimonadota bacterium]